jgi:F-type H+-transporting ATPase subunit epsilon
MILYPQSTLMPLRVQIVTAEREVYAAEGVDMVVAPGSEGVLGIMARHAPLLTTLQPGEIRVKKGATEEALAVGGGFLQVARDQVLILADTAERADEIDEARAEEARRRAEEQIAQRQSNQDIAIAEVELRRALIRLKVAQLKRNRRQ